MEDELVRASEARKELRFAKTIDLIRDFERMGYAVLQPRGPRSRLVYRRDIEAYKVAIKKPSLESLESRTAAALQFARRQAASVRGASAARRRASGGQR